jgi:hypothetical protein
MIIISVGAGASILQSSINTVVNGDLAKGQAEKQLIKKLKQHVIIFGYSHLGETELTHNLNEYHTYIQIYTTDAGDMKETI